MERKLRLRKRRRRLYVSYRDDFEDVLRDDMANDEQYENLSDEEFDAEVAKIVAETAFVKAIVIYVG